MSIKSDGNQILTWAPSMQPLFLPSQLRGHAVTAPKTGVQRDVSTSGRSSRPTSCAPDPRAPSAQLSPLVTHVTSRTC